VAAKRDRLLTVIGRRERWRDDLTRIRRLHAVVTDAEAILSAARWRAERAEQQARQQEQIKQHRVRHRRTDFLADLEARWAALAAGT